VIEVRDHRSERFNRARLELEIKRAARPAVIVAIGIVAGLALAAFIGVHISRTLPSSTHTSRFAVADATGVAAGADEVRFKGIPAGTITSVKMVNGSPVITAEIQNKYGPIYRNAEAQLRPNTALQDMYLDIVDPGTSAAGKATASAPVPATQTATSVNVDDVLDVFAADQRTRLRTLLDQMGNGLRDRGASLREAFVELTPLLQTAGRISEQLAARAPMTKRLVHNAAVLTTELGRRQRQLNVLVRSGSATLTTLQAGAADLDATLRALPPTLSTMDSSFTAVRGVLGDVDTAVHSLYPVADNLPTSLAALRRVGASATPAVQALQTPVQRLVALAKPLVPLSAGLSTTVSALGPQVGAIDHVTKSTAACKKGVQGFFQWNPSIAKYGDDRGNAPRGNVAIGAQSSGVITDPFEFAPETCSPGKPVGGRVPTASDFH
jgi:virulence factor Mce-like protein